jgi:pimeloyl-ACP methyl ester carboxylesterase
MDADGLIEWPNGKADTLAVVLHGWRGSREALVGVRRATRDALGPQGGVDIYVPNLPYGRTFCVMRATNIVVDLLIDIDEIIAERGDYKRIVLIGHSMGGVLARRLFLVATGIPPAVDDEPQFRCEEDFDRAEAAPRAWAALIDRQVTLGAFNRGWQASERDGWYYSFFFNTMGLLGHLAPSSKWRPTIFDLRVGAPFMAQTRLHWLAYRRWHQTPRSRSTSGGQAAEPTPPSPELLVVQIVGNSDDLASPLNQVDIAIERPDSSAAPSDQRFFFLEMEKSTHEQTIDFADRQEGRNRRDLFIAALTEPPDALAARASDPTLLVDHLPDIEPNVTDCVFVMHGIRDDGFWTSRIAKRVKERAPNACVLRASTPTYGYFAMLPFMLRWIRRQKTEWFVDQYVAARAQNPKARISFIGHSNGTYLAACALSDYADVRFENIFFAGSVVRRDYPWASLVENGRVQKFHNVRAARDWVVALLPKSVENWKILNLDLGGAGFDGFDDVGKHPSITQAKKFADGEHSAALVESQWSNIADFIISGREPPAEPAAAFVDDCSPKLKKWADRHCGIYIVLVLGLLVAPAIFVGSVYLIATFLAHLLFGWDFSTTVKAVMLTLAAVLYVLLLKFVITRV